MSMLLQLFITAIWGALLISSTRRLLRLAHVEQLQHWGRIRLRLGLNRMWWWLGQHEYWQQVRADSAICLQLTLMIFVIAWSIGV